MANYHELDIQSLTLKMIDGDIDSKNQLTEYYIKYINKIIQTEFKNFDCDKEELKKEMIKIMYVAINNYKINQNEYFSHYITKKIRQYYFRKLIKLKNKQEHKNRDIQQLAIKMFNGDNDALKQIIEFYTFQILKLVETKYCNADIEKEDLIQIGMVGLLKATQTYTIDYEYHFSTYVNNYINREMQREIKLRNSSQNIEYIGLANNYNRKTFDDFIENTEVREAIGNLSDIKKKILVLYLYENYTFEEIGNVLGFSTQRTQQHYKRALEIIKEQLLIDSENQKKL